MLFNSPAYHPIETYAVSSRQVNLWGRGPFDVRLDVLPWTPRETLFLLESLRYASHVHGEGLAHLPEGVELPDDPAHELAVEQVLVGGQQIQRLALRAADNDWRLERGAEFRQTVVCKCILVTYNFVEEI